jgi:5-methylcytosine-specific restriction enzyme subunit McrC
LATVAETESTIAGRDCSPFGNLSRADEDRLQRLVSATNAPDLLLRFDRRMPSADDEPVAFADPLTGAWYAGRYIGEVHYDGLSLRIEPRFGMPVLMRWLATIWNIRFVETKGTYQSERIWLWHIIAHLWASRLMSAAKHGLPTRRTDIVHLGRSLRGRLLVRQTALARGDGSDTLASMTRNRAVDATLGQILLAAFDRLQRALKDQFAGPNWLPERGHSLIGELRCALGVTQEFEAQRNPIIRYTPMTETYRSVIEFSLSILANRPLARPSQGTRTAFGVLMDMAEIWELYVAAVLRTGLREFGVTHTGRSNENFQWLLRSARDGGQFGSLRPDVLISGRDGRRVAIADAKYKTTRSLNSNRAGIATEDLYQLAAYF